ncbi:MAG: hypothetical protein HC921_20965 [Synechococcaceae cyanobacterium SM2_3_1]|nr:hypothetical protein [Synechococcaceae cyanobacterium SM2_3_1]
MMPRKRPAKFVSTAEIQSMFAVTRHFLYSQIYQGTLTHGLHYITVSNPNARKASYRWNADALWELWSTDPAIRDPGS